jgi:hypothetical protein
MLVVFRVHDDCNGWMFMATLRFLICETSDWMLDVCFSCEMKPPNVSPAISQ